ncbi:MAG: hypothetical protein JW791_02050 [Nanoarchaeota archaeon]|nr:hypothetical protein [Nanoarchaeota archaeon]
MIELSDCLNCENTCCENITVNLNVFDLAKILYSLRDYEFKDKEVKGTGWIYSKNTPLIFIGKRNNFYGVYLINCRFYKEKKCQLHNLKIKEDSQLADNLKKLSINLCAKPSVCRYHPYFYDYSLKKVRRLEPCNDVSKEAHRRAVIVKDFEKEEELEKTAWIIYSFNRELLQLFNETGELLFLEMAESLIKDKLKVNGNNIQIFQ